LVCAKKKHEKAMRNILAEDGESRRWRKFRWTKQTKGIHFFGRYKQCKEQSHIDQRVVGSRERKREQIITGIKRETRKRELNHSRRAISEIEEEEKLADRRDNTKRHCTKNRK
jgi:hypothetical protein